ncbi:hypothetical protein [uncultured Pseudokineococcus sp.]|uniref:hypothetical protein n=1 Tax=uncultured Pseudokineococcus sp. TaxID=1642928 RepID=UPI0026399E05|nr:hypothetical protein [uncultured Pseudokineococcus sp.]
MSRDALGGPGAGPHPWAGAGGGGPSGGAGPGVGGDAGQRPQGPGAPEDLDAPAAAGGAGTGGADGRTSGVRRRRAGAAAVVVALVAGGFALGRVTAPAPVAGPGAATASLATVPPPTGEDALVAGARPAGEAEGTPAAYAELFPDAGDRRSSTVVVSWAGVPALRQDERVAVAVVVDERTRVVGARLGDDAPGSAGVGLDRGDLARHVLEAAGERTTTGSPVVHVSRSSGTVAVELVDEGYDLTVATTPRVHLAVVRGTVVQQVLAVPLAGPRPRG